MERHFLFLYTTCRLQNCCRKEKVTIEDGGLDWRARNYLQDMMKVKGKGRIQHLLREVVYPGKVWAEATQTKGTSGNPRGKGQQQRQLPTQSISFKSGGDIEQPSAYFNGGDKAG